MPTNTLPEIDSFLYFECKSMHFDIFSLSVFHFKVDFVFWTNSETELATAWGRFNIMLLEKHFPAKIEVLPKIQNLKSWCLLGFLKLSFSI